MSVQYLIPAPVINYIEENGLYEEDSTDSKMKAKEYISGKVGSPKS
jgi:nicotinamide mononucleotide adenylyltransferase